MKKYVFIILSIISLSFCGIPVITVNGAINPVSAGYIIENLESAQEEQADCIILLLDTPGGLLSSTEDLTRAFMASKIPVVVYIYPKGGRAASAGVFLTYAAHIAAMAPGTRIGAAHPVDMMGSSGGKADSSSTMMEKVANDAVANLQAIAKERGRNQEWVVAAIRRSESVTADQALSLGVVDIIADSLPELIEILNGFVYGPDDAETLNIADSRIEEIPMSPLKKFLFTILNPNVAYLLMMLGMLGIFLELQNPGSILPGVVGGISILLAMYAFQILPINYVGIALILLAGGFFVLEAKFHAMGLLAFGGVVAMLAGSVLLTSGNPDFLRITWSVILPTVGFIALVIIIVVYKVAAARLSKPVSGASALVGEKGIIAKPRSKNLRDTLAELHGEFWAVDGDDLEPGDKIVVEQVNGFRLKVRKI